MSPPALLILGCGGHGRAVAEAVQLADAFQLVGFVDDAWAEVRHVWGIPVLGSMADLPELRRHASLALVAIGNNQRRQTLTQQLLAAGFELATIRHPSAVISPSAVIGAGSALMAGCIVGTEATLGAGVILNSGSVVDHHCRVEDFGHLGVAACMAGGSSLGQGSWIQAGGALGYGVVVPAWQTLAPGEGRS